MKLEIKRVHNETQRTHLYPVDLAEAIHYIGDKWQISPQSIIEKENLPDIIVSTLEWLTVANKGHEIVYNMIENHSMMLNVDAVGNWLRFYRISKLLNQEDALGYLASVQRGLIHLLDPESEMKDGDPDAVKSFSNIIEKL